MIALCFSYAIFGSGRKLCNPNLCLMKFCTEDLNILTHCVDFAQALLNIKSILLRHLIFCFLGIWCFTTTTKPQTKSENA